MRFYKLNDIGALRPDLSVDLVRSGTSESVDTLSKIARIGRLAVSDAIDNTELLRCEVLEFVNDDRSEVVPIQICYGGILKDQLGQAREIIVCEPTFGNTLPFYLQRDRITSVDELLFHRCIVDGLLLYLSQ